MKQRSTADWQRLDAAHYLHPFTDHKQLAEDGTRVIARAEGIYLYDNDGRQILDGMSGLWCVAMGYGRRELIDAATQQLQTLPYYNSFFQCAHPAAIELAELVTSLAPPQFKHVFFTGSGSEANDTAVRMVRRYWDLLGQPQRQIIVSRWNGYHGSTMAGASLGGMKAMHGQGGLPIPDIEHIEQPYWFERGGGMTPHEFGLSAARELEQKILQLGPERVAAFIAEPVQGAGGVIIPPHSYWPEIQRIVDQYGILLISDEVICGFGRTGHWFGADYYGIRPDLMPIAKAMSSGYIPIGGLLVADRVADVLIEQGGEFFHGFTYSGHPVACAVALANLRLMQSAQIVDRVRSDLAPYWSACWASLADHPLVGEARALGLFGAIELVTDKATRTASQRRNFEPRGSAGMICRDRCVRNGLIMRAVWDTMIVAPPLIISHAQIDELLDKVRRSLDQTHAALYS